MRKGDDLTTFIVLKVEKIRSLNLLEPLGPHRPVAGHLYLYLLHVSVTAVHHQDTATQQYVHSSTIQIFTNVLSRSKPSCCTLEIRKFKSFIEMFNNALCNSKCIVRRSRKENSFHRLDPVRTDSVGWPADLKPLLLRPRVTLVIPQSAKVPANFPRWRPAHQQIFSQPSHSLVKKSNLQICVYLLVTHEWACVG